MTKEVHDRVPVSEFMSSPLVVLDQDGHIAMMNHPALDLIQDPIDGRLDRRTENPVEARYLWLSSALEAAGDSPEAVFNQELVTRGGAKKFHVRLSRMLTPRGEACGTVAILSPVSYQQSVDVTKSPGYSEPSPSNLIDDLTGLYNRRGFSASAAQLLKLADQLKRHLAFLMCSIEEATQADTAGTKQTDDQALLAVAAVLHDTFRVSDIIARVGKGEFAVLAAGSFESGAEELAIRLQTAVDQRRSRGELGYKLSISVGLIPFDPLYPRDVDDLLARIPGDV